MIQETFPMIIGEEEIPNERALLTQEDGPMMASSASVKYIVIHCSATVSTQFRASPFERALFSALNRVLLIN